MFEHQNQLAPIALIQKRRPPLSPGPDRMQTVVTGWPVRLVRRRPLQWQPTKIADQPANQRGFAPTGPTQAEIALNHIATDHAARRIEQPQCGLNSLHQKPIVRDMHNTPQLTDRTALQNNRRRANADRGMFLQTMAAEDIQDRLEIVNRTFTAPAIVTAFPDIWRSVFPDAVIVADTDILDLQPGAHDLVIHAMALHWANDPVGQLIQCRHALKNDGLLISASFGGQTLQELRAALGQAETEVTGGLSPRVVPMAEIRDLGGLLQRAGFALPVADSLPLTVTYDTPWHLMRDLRAMGETNALHARARRFTNPSVLRRAADLYAQSFATDGRVTATFEIIFMTGWAPDESQPKPLRPGSAEARLAEALGTEETKLKD